MRMKYCFGRTETGDRKLGVIVWLELPRTSIQDEVLTFLFRLRLLARIIAFQALDAAQGTTALPLWRPTGGTL